MNIHRTGSASYFLFNDQATGTGGASAPPGGTASPSPAPASGSAPSPAATPPSASPSGAPEALPSASPGPGGGATDSNDPFAGLGMDFGDLDEVILPDSPGNVPATAAGTAQPGGQQPPAPAAQPAPAPAAPAPAAAQPPAAPPPPAATGPISARDQLKQTVDGFKANSADLSKWAGQELFKLSDEEVTALTTDAAGVIPSIMGRVYAQSLHATANLIQNLVPNLIEQMADQQHATRARASEAMNQFWTENKDLNAKDHGELVASYAKVFRQANPKAPRAEAIAFVARAIRAQLGLPMPGAGQPPAAAPAPQAFAPARPGGRTPPPPATNDPYAGLGMDFDDEGHPT